MNKEYLIPPAVVDLINDLNKAKINSSEYSNYMQRVDAIILYLTEAKKKFEEKSSCFWGNKQLNVTQYKK